MAFRILLIALITYGLGMPDTVRLVSRYLFQTELQTQRMGYVKVFRSFRWRGLGYLLLADLLRALIAVLVGGLLLKQPGFPTVGKQLAMFFALLGQTMPITRRFRSREDLVFPLLLLLFVDGRIFLIVLVAALALLMLTGKLAPAVLCGLALYPLFTLIFGGWWLKILLAIMSSAAIFHVFRDTLLSFVDELRHGGRRRPAAPQQDEEEDGEV